MIQTPLFYILIPIQSQDCVTARYDWWYCLAVSLGGGAYIKCQCNKVYREARIK